MKRRAMLLLAAAAIASLLQSGRPLLLPCADAAAVADDEMVVVSGVVSPQVAYGLSRQEGALTVRISVAPFETPAPREEIGLQLGLAADKAVTLSEKDARVEKTDQAVIYEFRVPDGKLAASREGWDKLRMGIAVSWPGGPFGQPRQSEAFLQNKTKATHAGLSTVSEDWQLLSLTEHERAMTDRRLQIAIDFRQPIDGKATIVIDDEQGRRVRNLISGQTMSAGSHRIVWDVPTTTAISGLPENTGGAAFRIPA